MVTSTMVKVEMAAQAVNYDFSGVNKPNASDELYSIRYSEFVMPLVKAVQELSEKTINQDRMIDNLKAEYETLSQRLEKLESLLAEKE